MDYRIVIRDFEYERMMAASDDGKYVNRFASKLLRHVYDTDARKLERNLPRFPEAHRTLYAVNALIGQVENGGIAQFLFNVGPVLLSAVPEALGRIGAAEMRSRLIRVFAREEEVGQRLASIRGRASSWEDYLEYKRELGEGKDFDDWFFDGQTERLYARMREFIILNKTRYVRVCDESPRLSRLWTRRILADLIATSREYDRMDRENCRFGGFWDLLFHPSIRDSIGDSAETVRDRAKAIAEDCLETLRRGARAPRRVEFIETPSARLAIDGRSLIGDSGRVTLAYHENELDMMWAIAEWPERSSRSRVPSRLGRAVTEDN